MILVRAIIYCSYICESHFVSLIVLSIQLNKVWLDMHTLPSWWTVGLLPLVGWSLLASCLHSVRSDCTLSHFSWWTRWIVLLRVHVWAYCSPVLLRLESYLVWLFWYHDSVDMIDWDMIIRLLIQCLILLWSLLSSLQLLRLLPVLQ